MPTKSIAWNTGNGNITLTYQGQGDGPISIQTDANNGSARSQVITVETVGGAITRNFTISQAACPFPVGDVKNFAYTGSYQEVELPAGQYKLQCWGAQGGSNAAASSYSITAKAGGKGGYSEGIITLTQKTTVRVYVGGQGSSSAGGFNGGGSTTGSSSYSTGTSGQAGYVYGTSRMGGGGGATDIRLSDGALLSRIIVAGGGSGGAMTYRAETTSTTSWQTVGTYSCEGTGGVTTTNRDYYMGWYGIQQGVKYRITLTNIPSPTRLIYDGADGSFGSVNLSGATTTFTAPKNHKSGSNVCIKSSDPSTNNVSTAKIKVEKQVTTTSTNSYTDSQVGFAGGGTTGVGYSSTYQGKQNGAGSGGSFGQGANQTITNYRHCSGAGGGGWYGGGGGSYSDSSTTNCRYSGGGSGFVNTAASAGNRPSGYIGLQLDSGETKAGNTSFPSTSGGTETGHSGNGYAKITRLA